ncbi:hypothetical protein SAMN05216410_1006 [Sanguibacter gelidistatuariae]|uniref:Uncharacterized protein n=1 Tax=Sanguibacter gelidistatuariae TaxID=1814289 RepID=A0A1G6HGK6_9MICO|nr:hypothetical protein [Sanguibacter gelidistatuariae]SDB93304.1 hypothetical protein SAMN05216410_1006 [Sanguibacter gelidistatuariae]
MSWPTYDPAQLEFPAVTWWQGKRTPALVSQEYEPFPGRVLAPIPAVFPVLDLLGVVTPSAALLDVTHTQTALFYVSGHAISDAVLDGEVRDQDLLDLEEAHRSGPVTAYDKRAVVARGRVQQYWPRARGSGEFLTFFVPPTVHGGDALRFTVPGDPRWQIPAAVVLSARMCTPVLVGSQVVAPQTT